MGEESGGCISWRLPAYSLFILTASVGRIVFGANRLWGETSMGQNAHGAKRLWGEMSFHGTKCPWGEQSINRVPGNFRSWERRFTLGTFTQRTENTGERKVLIQRQKDKQLRCSSWARSSSQLVGESPKVTHDVIEICASAAPSIMLRIGTHSLNPIPKP